MTNNLKHSISLVWIAVILISGYKIFSPKEKEVPVKIVEPAVEKPAEPIVTPAPPPQIIIQERIVTQTVVVAQAEEVIEAEPSIAANPELEKVKRELLEINVALEVNAKEFYPALMEVKRLSTEGSEASVTVTKLKQGISLIRNELAAIEAELKSYKKRKEFTSGFRKYGEKGLNERRETLKTQITQAKQVLREKEAQVKKLKLAYDKANAEKIRIHRERLEHNAWQKELKKQIQALQTAEVQ